MNLRAYFAVAVLSFLAMISPALAEDDAAVLAWEAAKKAATLGPGDIPLRDQATLHLPANMAFVPEAAAGALMKAWGNSAGPSLHGVVIPTAESEYWFVTIDHTAEGFVKDDDAKTWNAGDLLQSIKEGTEAQNKEREKMGVAALDVIGWIEPPNYDSTAHRLVWSLEARSRGDKEGEPTTVNYNTYALGRDGYFEFDLVTSSDVIAKEKGYARQLLAALEYSPGKRYEDFNDETDHMAEYGLAALIGGVAAKKLGLFALAGVFIAKFFKFILIGLAVAGGSIYRFFFGKKSGEA